MFRVYQLRAVLRPLSSLNNSRGPAIRVKVFSGSIFGGGHSLERNRRAASWEVKFLRILSGLAAR
jgi:hypothetical protein